VLPLNFGLECRATAATVDVSAQLAALRCLPRGCGQSFSDFPAVSVPGPTTTPERLTGLEDQRLDLLSAYAECCTDLSMGLIPELEQNKRRTLIGWEAADVVDQLSELF